MWQILFDNYVYLNCTPCYLNYTPTEISWSVLRIYDEYIYDWLLCIHASNTSIGLGKYPLVSLAVLSEPQWMTIGQ